MRNKYLLFFLFILFCLAGLHAQWVLENPEIQSENLTTFDVLDNEVAWAGGMFGTVLFTDNSGKTWKVLDTNLKNNITSLSFVNKTNGWLTAYMDKSVYHTDDGGKNWYPSVAFNSQVNKVLFVNDSIGFITGNFSTLLRTGNKGVSWDTVKIVSSYVHSYSEEMYFLNEKVGFVSTVNSIFKTTDGGKNWTYIFLLPEDFMLGGIYFYDNDKGFVFGLGYMSSDSNLYFTEDGGTSWKSKRIGSGIKNVYFISKEEGWLCSGTIYHTTDGGKTWQNTGIEADGFQFFDTTTGIGQNKNLIIRTTDAWQTAALVTPSATNVTLYNISALDSNRVVACGEEESIVQTLDGGNNWNLIHHGESKPLNAIFHKSINDIWAVGSGGRVIHTSDGGQTWDRFFLQSNWLSDILFISDSTGFIIGDDSTGGRIFYTHDAGLSWHLDENISIPDYLIKLKFTDETNGWLAGEKSLYKTTDGGNSWEKVLEGYGLFTDFDAIGDTLFLLGSNRLRRSFDAGITWEEFTIFDYDDVYFFTNHIAFINNRHGFCVLQDGRVLNTRDGGDTWQEDKLTAHSLYGIIFSDDKNVWAAGDGGTIFHYKNYISNLSQFERPLVGYEFILYQNFPNPFNPQTVLKYNVPHAGHVSLNIYNTLGQKIKTLVDEFQYPGIYKVMFYGENLPNGLYFCRLKVNSSMRTIKIVLQK